MNTRISVWRVAPVINVGVLRMSKINVLRTFGILFVSAVCFMACSPEEYGPCSIPNTKAHTVACSPVGAAAAEDTFATATCAVDYVFDCDSLICGIYQSSDPFCTHRCLPSASECTSTRKKNWMILVSLTRNPVRKALLASNGSKVPPLIIACRAQKVPQVRIPVENPVASPTQRAARKNNS